MKIDGGQIASEILKKLKQKGSPEKTLAAILVGENKQSESFLRQKGKAAEELGVGFSVYKLSEELNDEELKTKIEEISNREDIGGVILQLPLPKGTDTEKAISSIPTKKDVDALGSASKVFPPAIEVVKEILERTNTDISKSSFAVVGVGRLVGKPVSDWLGGKCKKLYLIDEGNDLESVRDADVVISGAGVAGLINPGELKSGAGVIDFGYSYGEGVLSGDLRIENGEEPSRIKFYTPTPGGTGPILVAKLFENFYKLCGQL